MATTMERDSHGRFKHKEEAGFFNSRTAVIAGATAAGAALGVLAMIGRKVMVQAPSALAGDWQEALKLEHKAALAIFDLIEATDDTDTVRRTLHLAQLKHALAKHALEEESVIYPALRDAGEDVAADDLNTEHGYVKQYLYDLENMPMESPDFLAKVREFRTELEAHIRDEENDLFPRLHDQLGDEENARLTRAMNREGIKLA